MTIEELYEFLGDFIKKHPKCKNKPIMVKHLKKEGLWEEVTGISDTVVDSCPEYGSPLYFHSKSQEEVTAAYNAKMREMDDDDPYYM